MIKNELETNIKHNLLEALKDKAFYIKTYGCQMNVNDSSSAKSMFLEFGMREVFAECEADLIMISTCCVREKAELKVYSYIGSLKAQKRKNQDLIIIISGCMSEQEEVKKEIFSKFHYVDIIVGTSMIDKIPYYINECIVTQHRINYELELKKGFEIPLRNAERVSEFVTIMTGCNNFCSYCIVPHVRGREHSRNADEIIAEIKGFVENGCVEITLLGQNVNSYGLDNDGLSFAGLLTRVSNETDVKRIRFMTSHPKDLTDEVIELMASEDKICNHIHLPLQSGSDRILQKMNRKYDFARYYHIIEYAKKLMPNIEFTTDIIVGFPGESDEDFEDTLKAVRKVRFVSAYMFKYSKRTGTPAAEYDNQLELEIKKERLKLLMDVEAEIKKEVYSTYVGSVQEILVEGVSVNQENYVGKTASAITVNFTGDKEDIGKLINVKIIKAKTNTLFAEKI